MQTIDHTSLTTPVSRIICAGYAGRDQAGVRHHIEELKAMGVLAPETVPAFYLVPPQMATADGEITVKTGGTSGEIEFVLFETGEGTLVTVGSDHTDREMERTDVPRSKAICPKVIAPVWWRLCDVIDHWDRLRLTSTINVGGYMELYQDGYVAELLSPSDLWKIMAERMPAFGPGDMLFSGTVPAKDGLIITDLFEMRLHDDVTGLEIKHQYKIRVQ